MRHRNLLCCLLPLTLSILITGCKPDAPKPAPGHNRLQVPSSPPLPENLPTDRPVTIRDTYSDYEDGGYIKENKKSTAKGPGADINGEKAAVQAQFGSPSIVQDSDVIGGGSAGATASAESLSGHAASPLVWAGLLGLVGAGVLVYFRMLREAAIAAGVSVACFVAAIVISDPTLRLIVVGVTMLIGAVTLLFFLKRGKDGTEAARAVISAVADFKEDPALYTRIKNRVKAHAEKNGPIDDEKTIDRLKRKDGL